MPTNVITTRRDAGGLRQFLDGRPLHAGTPIQVFFREQGVWIDGRYEWTYRDSEPALFVVPGVGTMKLDWKASVRRNV